MSPNLKKNRTKVRDRNRKKEFTKEKIRKEEYTKSIISKIRTFDDPILKEKCSSCSVEEDIFSLIYELTNVLKATKNGVGLSASQIGYTKSVIAIRPEVTGDIKILINPEIIANGDIRLLSTEGCLSYPGYFAKILRYSEITVKFLDIDKKPCEEKFNGKESIIIQHEVEHLSGICQLYDTWKSKQSFILSDDDYKNALEKRRKMRRRVG